MKTELPLLSKLMIEALTATLPHLPGATRTAAIVRCVAQVYLTLHGDVSPWEVMGISVKEIEQHVESVSIVIEENAKTDDKADDANSVMWSSKNSKEALDYAMYKLTHAHRDLSGTIAMLERLGMWSGNLSDAQVAIRERLEFLRMHLKAAEKASKHKGLKQ